MLTGKNLIVTWGSPVKICEPLVLHPHLVGDNGYRHYGGEQMNISETF